MKKGFNGFLDIFITLQSLKMKISKMKKLNIGIMCLGMMFFSNSILAQSIEDGKKFMYYERYKSAKDVFHRLSLCWKEWGEKYGYFDTPQDAQIFYDEVTYMLANQMAAPQTPARELLRPGTATLRPPWVEERAF